jgi:hypothetical protein
VWNINVLGSPTKSARHQMFALLQFDWIFRHRSRSPSRQDFTTHQ